jgi:4-amino-4-deoxy-L-arabinose transferase-like glycosyltransferase
MVRADQNARTVIDTGVLTVLAAALVLRIAIPLFALAVVKSEPQFSEPDTDGYLRVATQWRETGSYALQGEPEIVRTPGYPLLLMPGVVAGQVEAVTIGLQILLACLTVWLVYRTTLSAFGDRTIALTAAWLLACEPLSTIYTSKLLSETLFTTILAAASYLLVRHVSSRSWRSLTAAAVAVAAAAYVRPIAYFLPLWIAVTLLAVGWRQPRERRRVAFQAMAFAGLGMALLVPWQIRNWLEADYAGFSAISDVNLYYYEALPVVVEQRGIGPAERDRARIEAGATNLATYLRQHPEQTDWPSARRYRFLRDEAVQIIRAHPLDWARLHLAGMLHSLTDSGRNAWLGFFRLIDTSEAASGPGPQNLWQRLSLAAARHPLVLAIHALLAAILLIYLVLAAVGVLVARGNSASLVILSFFLYLLLLSGGDAGYHRFRLPLTPAICIFAACGYQMLSKAIRGFGWPIAWPGRFRRITGK